MPAVFRKLDAVTVLTARLLPAPPDGIAVFAALCRVYGQPWPDTLTVATPHAGLHLYFRVPPGLAAASAISRWPGIDIRAPG